MAYDKKSDIGVFTASPSNKGDGQVTIFKSNHADVALPLGENVEVDLLNMDEFGYNTVILRDKLGVIDANSVNTDREYGVFQIDDKYRFNEICFVSVSYSTSSTLYEPRVITSTTNNAVSKLEDGTAKLKVSGSNLLMLPHIMTTVGDLTGDNKKTSLYGLQGFCASGGACTWKIGDSALVSNTGAVNINDQNLLSTNDSNGLISGNAGTRGDFLAGIKAFVTNNSSLYRLKFFIRGWNDDGNEYSDLTNILLQGEADTVSIFPPDGLDDFELVLTVLDENNNPVDYHKSITDGHPMIGYRKITVTDRTDHDKSIQAFEHYFGTTNHIMPECTIAFEWHFTNPKIQRSFCRYSKSVASNAAAIYVLNNIGNVYDWTNYKYAPALLGSYTDEELKTSMINATNSSTYLIGSDFSTVVGFNITGDSEKIVGYTKLVEIDSDRSIVLLKRNLGSVQIGVLDGINVVSAADDASLELKSLVINNLNVISASGFGFDFTVTINNRNKYYSFYTQDSIDGNKLIRGSRKIPMLQCIDIDYPKEYEQLGFTNYTTLAPTVSMSTVALDDNLYYRTSEEDSISFTNNGEKGSPTLLYLATKNGMKNCLLEYRTSGVFVSDALSFYLPNATSFNGQVLVSGNTSSINPFYKSGRDYIHIATMPAYDTTIASFASLPLRMEDEYPEVYNNSGAATSSFMLGKTMFVFKDGTLYESGSLTLCPNTNRVYVSEPGSIIYKCGHLIFIASANVTSVYAFSELGLMLMYVIEDKIICNPVKLSFGVVAVGCKNIWSCLNEGATKIHSYDGIVTNAAIKTRLDNSAIVVSDSGKKVWNYLIPSDSDGGYLVSGSDILAVSGVSFDSISINQFGHLSKSEIDTDFVGINIINPGQQSDLIVIDNQAGIVAKLLKTSSEFNDSQYSIQTSQIINVNNRPLNMAITQLAIFAKGIGNIVFNIDGEERVIEVCSQKYKKHLLNVHSDFNCFDFSINVDKDVKMLQKVIGILSIKEEYYG